MGRSEGVPEELGVIANRIDYVELLEEATLHTNEIVAELDDSRSTVTRALRELRDAGFVEKTPDGYTVTTAGALVATLYREYAETTTAIVGADDLLDPLDDATDLPPAVFRESTTFRSEADEPFTPMEAVTDAAAEADTISAYLPTLSTPRLLHVCHERVVEGRLDLDATFRPTVFRRLKGRYPEVFGEMATGPLMARTFSGPDYGVVLVETAGEAHAWVLIHTESGSLHGALRSHDPAVVAWAEQRIAEIQSAAETVTDQISDLLPETDEDTTSTSDSGHQLSTDGRGTKPERSNRVTADNEGTSGSTDDATLPTELREEGFVRLSDSYLEEESAVPAKTVWKAGLTLADVAEGRAITRSARPDDPDDRFDETVRRRLRNGEDCVVLGGPGAGKSTICKQVACAWYERDIGPVIYRECGVGQTFESPEVLEGYLRRIDGHPLVVVEDIVRADAVSVFETMAAFRGSPDVSFLFDARDDEWQEAFAEQKIPRPEVVEEWKPTPMPIPELDESDCQRFVDRFEEDVGVRVDRSGAELLEEIRDGDGGSHPGSDALLVKHHLSTLLSDAPATASADETVLEAAAVQTCRELRDCDSEVPLDVAVLATVLTTAGLPVSRDLLYTLLREWSAREIETALQHVEGTVLFETPDESPTFRARHEAWAEKFLTRLGTVMDADAAITRFERCVNALFSLADDPLLREEIKRTLGYPTPNINQATHDSRSWADETVERVFGIGIRQPRLRYLFDDSVNSGINVPETVSTEVRIKQYFWRGRMAELGSDSDSSRSEYERLRERIDTTDGLSEQTALELKAHSWRGQAILAALAGDRAFTAQCAQRALDLANRLDDDRLAVRIECEKGCNHIMFSEWRVAREHIERGLERAAEIDYRRYIARGQIMLADIAWNLGNLRRAEQLLEAGYEEFQVLDDWLNEGNTSNVLSMVAFDRDELDRAQQYAYQNRAIAREHDDRWALSNAAWNLARVTCARGQLDRASEHIDEAISLAKETELETALENYYRARARIARYRGDFNEAATDADRARRAAEDFDNEAGVAKAIAQLIEVALARNDLDRAAELLEESLPYRAVVRSHRIEAKFDALAARVAYRDGEHEAALALVGDAIEEFRLTGQTRREAEARRIRALVRAARGNANEALACARRAVDVAEESDVVYTVGRVAETAGDVALEAGEPDAAIEHYRRAENAFDDLDNAARVRSIEERRSRPDETL